MMRQVHEIIIEVAERRQIDPALIVTRCRRDRVFRARAEVAKILHERGYSTNRIGRLLHHDHTTIVYYLGNAKKKPKPEIDPRPRWRSPRVRHLCWLTTEASRRRKHRARRLRYAGFDRTEIQIRGRTHASAQDHG